MGKYSIGDIWWQQRTMCIMWFFNIIIEISSVFALLRGALRSS